MVGNVGRPPATLSNINPTLVECTVFSGMVISESLVWGSDIYGHTLTQTYSVLHVRVVLTTQRGVWWMTSPVLISVWSVLGHRFTSASLVHPARPSVFSQPGIQLESVHVTASVQTVPATIRRLDQRLCGHAWLRLIVRLLTHVAAGAGTMQVGPAVAVQSQKAVSAYFTSKQILPFGFAEQYLWPTILIRCAIGSCTSCTIDQPAPGITCNARVHVEVTNRELNALSQCDLPPVLWMPAVPLPLMSRHWIPQTR